MCSVSGETWVLTSVPRGGEKLLDIKSGHQVNWSKGLLRCNELVEVFSSLRKELLGFLACYWDW